MKVFSSFDTPINKTGDTIILLEILAIFQLSAEKKTFI